MLLSVSYKYNVRLVYILSQIKHKWVLRGARLVINYFKDRSRDVQVLWVRVYYTTICGSIHTLNQTLNVTFTLSVF